MDKKTFIKSVFPNLYLKRWKKVADRKLKRNQLLSKMPDQERLETLKGIFRKKLGYELDIDHPQTWCEKMQWLKLYDATQEKTDWTDKIKAKELASQKIGSQYVIGILGKRGYKSFDEIDFSTLPRQFVIKTNHGSGCNFFVKNKWLFLHSGLYKVARTYFKYWMQMDYGFDDGFELHYSAIERRIFVEEYVPALYEDLEEFRFMCFEGKPEYVEVKTGGHGLYRNIYDMDWNPLDVKWGHEQNTFKEKPVAYDEMKDLVGRLCKGFHFVRIDLNYSGGQIYFGEMTFTSGSGFVRIKPKEFDDKLGELIHI